MEQTIKIEVPATISKGFYPIGFVRDYNGCCSDRPILITANKAEYRLNYSCQCACGMWCTNGHKTASEALKEYEEMTRRNNKV